jgi:Beta-propeller repeat
MMPRSRWFCWVTIPCLIVPSVLSAHLSAAAVPPEPPSPTTSQQVTATMMRMPLQFEANQGQVDAQVKFLARGKGYTLFLTPTESVMVLQQRETAIAKDPLAMTKPTAVPQPAPIKQAIVRMKLEGANQAPAIDGMEKHPGIVNYFIGNDPKKWRTEIPTYAKVQYQEAYPGIDLAYYGNQGKLEYDFIVAPGADPRQIKLAFEGASDIHLAESGDLLLSTELGEVRMQKPIVYQLEPDGHKTLVAGNYIASPKTPKTVAIQLAAYDHTKPVVIDPVLSYSTYLGGNNNDQAHSIAVDSSGNAYMTGWTESTNFPTTVGSFQTIRSEHGRVSFVTKLNPTGSSLVYSTYLGGGQGLGIAVDGLGNAYVTGKTDSGDFPTTAGAFQITVNRFGAAFITKLNPAGSSLVYSTYLSGSSGFSVGQGIAVDASGNAYVTGLTVNSSEFPTTPEAFQATSSGDYDAFVTKLNPTGSGLSYSTYLGKV